MIDLGAAKAITALSFQRRSSEMGQSFQQRPERAVTLRSIVKFKIQPEGGGVPITRGGRIVWLRGQCPQNLDDAKNIDSHDPVEQTHKVMQNIRQLIEEAGGRMEHLVKVVVYLTDVRHREAVYRTMGEYIKGVHPVSTGLVVQALARPEWLVEIDGTAVIPD